MYLRARSLFTVLTLLAAALMGHSAVAAINISTAPVSVNFSSQNNLHVLNLRLTKTVSGTAPLRLTQAVFLQNGQVPSTNILQFAIVPAQSNSICIAFNNLDFSPQSGPMVLQLTLANAKGEILGPISVPVNDAPGIEIDPQADLAACADPNSRPVANASATPTNVSDSDQLPGEFVTLDASLSSDANADNVLTYTWAVGNLTYQGVRPLVQLADGPNTVRLTVTDDSGDAGTNSATASITVNVAAPTFQANAGPDQTVNDTDGAPGETVTLDASGSLGDIDLYQWFIGEDEIGRGPTLQAKLPDGVTVVTLVTSIFQGEGSISDSDDVQITVNPPSAVAANAGADRTVADSDLQSGESVTLDGSASSGTIAAYNWFLETGSESRDALGSGVTITVALPDGVNTVTLEVTDSLGNVSSDSVQITVAAAPERTTLSEIPNLTPNQKRMAGALDDICGRVLDTGDGGGTNTPTSAAAKARPLATQAEVSDLASKCRGLLFNNTTANQVDALDELNGEDFAVARTQALLFANFQQAGILDRLMALRGGARGLSLAGLNIMIDGKPVPLATLSQMAQDLFGGGAASDADEAGGLLSDKWGMWMRGNYSTGGKDASASSPAFDADQFALIGGLDYRLSDKAVVGLSMAYGDSTVDFNPRSEGGLDTTSWAVSAYGSMYAAQNFYLDAILNVANADYAADRNITYVDGQGLVNADARGDTDGMTYSAGLSLGYDFLVKGLTISPNVGLFYIDATIDSFTESGAGGLNLIYDEQQFKSLTSNLGLRVTYAWNLNWGVLLPHVRVDYVREFEDDVDVFGIRFAADPNATSAPPILVETDNPDTSYWRLATGLSAQFPLGFSGYVEYQRLESFQFISFEDISVGLRMQKSF